MPCNSVIGALLLLYPSLLQTIKVVVVFFFSIKTIYSYVLQVSHIDNCPKNFPKQINY